MDVLCDGGMGNWVFGKGHRLSLTLREQGGDVRSSFSDGVGVTEISGIETYTYTGRMTHVEDRTIQKGI